MRAQDNLSETNDADDALSSSARAVTVEPLGADTWTLQVMSSVLAQMFMAVCNEETGKGEFTELGAVSVEGGVVVSFQHEGECDGVVDKLYTCVTIYNP